MFHDFSIVGVIFAINFPGTLMTTNDVIKLFILPEEQDF